MSSGVTSLTSDGVVAKVIDENQCDMERQLAEAKDNLRDAKIRLPSLEQEVQEVEQKCGELRVHRSSHSQQKKNTQWKLDRLKQELSDKKEAIKEHKYSIAYCRHYLDLKPPSEALGQASHAVGEEPFALMSPTVEDTAHSTEELSLQEAESQ